jgi:tetratricopeptide (TPR) repeat protein
MARNRRWKKKKKNSKIHDPEIISSSPGDTLVWGRSAQRPDWRTVGFSFLLLFLILAAYSSILGAGFIWDDDAYLTENPLIRDFDGLRRIWFTTETPQYYPLVFTSFWLERLLWGLHPLGYHLVNILLHAGSALLVWRILLGLGVPGAWLIGAVFALHPVHVESVAWITERKNVLSGLFYLLSMRAYLTFDAKGRAPTYLIAAFFFFCALLSKTITATLPAVLLVIIWYQGKHITWQRVRLTVPFFVLGAVAGLFTAWLEFTIVGAYGKDFSLNIAQRIILAGKAYWFYIWKLVWPSNLIFTYPRWKLDFQDPLQYLGILGVVIAVFISWRWRRSLGRGPAAALAFSVISLMPVLGFLNFYPMRFSYVADHFQYIASLGLISLLGGGAARWWIKTGNHIHLWGKLAAAALLAVLGLLTWWQVRIYENEETLWRDTLRKNSESWMAHNNLGLVLTRQGKIHDAIRHYREALRIRPRHSNALNNLGSAFFNLGKIDEAIEMHRRALDELPENAFARSNLGRALVEKGRIKEGIKELELALRLRPAFAGAHNNMGVALMGQGKLQDAIRHFSLAIKVNSDLAESRNNLGVALAQLGRFREAIATLKEGVQRHPEDAPLAYSLAWQLSTAPRPEWREGEAALRLMRKFMKNSGNRNPFVLNALAAAYAELGRFEEAVNTAREAASRADEAGEKEMAFQIRSLMQGYDKKIPYRSPDP